MTPKQLETKLKQLYSRRRLILTVDELEESIKTFMAIENKSEIRTANFTLRLAEGGPEISLRPRNYPNQLTFKFMEKEELKYETDYPKETLT